MNFEFVLDSKIEVVTGVHGEKRAEENDPLAEEMRIRPRTGGIRGGGGPVEVGRRQVLPGGERRRGRGRWKNCSREAVHPAAQLKGARSLRPEIPAQGAELLAPGNSGP